MYPPGITPPPVIDGRCGTCGHHGHCWAANTVLSASFASWDDINTDTTTHTRLLCPACAWAYKTVPMKMSLTIADATPSRTMFDAAPSTVRALLANPLTGHIAVIAPIGGKRIVAPRARWGHVATDTAVVRWTTSRATLLGYGERLRALGVGPKALTQPSPPFAVLATTPVDTHEEMRRLWRLLAPARADRALLPIIQRVLRADPKGPPA